MPKAAFLFAGLFAAIAVLPLSVGTSSAESPVGKIYYGEAGTIMRSNLDGSDVEEIVPEGVFPDLAIDKAGEHIYWTDAPGGRILRADVDGGNIVELVTGIPGLWRLALDGAGMMYWTTRDGGNLFDSGTIWRADADGSNIESVLAFVALFAVAVDPIEGYIYWSGLNTIFRSPLDGGSMEEWAVASGGYIIMDLAIDRDAHDVYYVSWLPPAGTFVFEEGAAGKIGSDGSVAWAFGALRPFHIALDLEHEHAYWADHGTQQVLRAGLDGADWLVVDSFDCCLGGIAFGPCPAGDTCSPPAPLTPLPAITPTPNPVGGVSLGSGLTALQDGIEGLETNETRGGRLMPWLGAAGVAATLALICAAWYAHRRWGIR